MSLTVVGDIDQLLYRFTGATPEANMGEGFDEQFPEAEKFMLTTNFRSTGEIVKAQLELIRYNYSNAGGPYAQEMLKELNAFSSIDGEKVQISNHLAAEDEAASVADKIATMIDAGDYEPGDFFVGARTKAQLGYLEGDLLRRKVPFINITTNGSFWHAKHIAAAAMYVILANDSTNKEAFKAVYNISSSVNTDRTGEYSATRYLGQKFLQACKGSYQNVDKAVHQRKHWKYGVEDLKTFIWRIQDRMNESSVSQLVQFVIDNSIRDWLIKDEGIVETDGSENGKLEDLKTVVEIASQFDTIDEFAAYVFEARKQAEDAKSKNWNDYVILSTIHRLKGLERKVVFGIGISEVADVDSYGQPYGLLPHTFSMTSAPCHGVIPFNDMGRVEDERCLLFVLISRAKELVFLSTIATYRNKPMAPSRFLAEI